MAVDASAMTNSWLTDHASMAMIFQVFGWLLAGALLGSFHFLTLRRNVHMFGSGRALLPFGLQLLRLAMVAAALTIIARSFGALPLLAAALGLLAARTVVLRWEMQP
jgi:F1F0 ATPase subunit 2